MAKARKESPAVSTPPPTSNSNLPMTTNLTKSGKRKKIVTWPPDNELVSIRIIEKAIYDDDPVDVSYSFPFATTYCTLILHIFCRYYTQGMHTSHNIRDLDRAEGAALHHHLFEEAIDWFEPLRELIEFSHEFQANGMLTAMEIILDVELPVRGVQSQEKTTQERREQTALGARYVSPAQIPDNPAEPSNVIPDDTVDKDMRVMTCGPDVDAIFWSGPAPTNQQMATVADLVGQLSAGNIDLAAIPPSNGQPTTLTATGLDPNAVATIQSIPQEQLQQLLQLAQQTAFSQNGQANVQPLYGGVDQNWNSTQYAEYGQDDGGSRHWPSEGRGRARGRGRGRGRGEDGGYRSSKRKPCTFFAAGRRALNLNCQSETKANSFLVTTRCRYGDQCDFSHDPIT
jgi:protein phosphatase 1 regulatory subunit 10